MLLQVRALGRTRSGLFHVEQKANLQRAGWSGKAITCKWRLFSSMQLAGARGIWRGEIESNYGLRACLRSFMSSIKCSSSTGDSSKPYFL